MAELDFTDVIEAPEFNEPFSVYRRSNTVGVNGRSQVSEVLHPGLNGVLYFEASETDVDEANARPNRQLIVITQFRLRDSSDGGLPDDVFYEGSRYTIKSAVPWTKYGQGWVRGTAELKKAVIPPAN